MTRPELRVFLQEWFCGCGDPEAAAQALLSLLKNPSLYRNEYFYQTVLPDPGTRYLLLYILDRFELTEHGSSIYGAWLTEKGKAVRDALAREESDNFNTLMEQSCIHGYSIDCEEVCSECSKESQA
jgi:hypothetical protein